MCGGVQSVCVCVCVKVEVYRGCVCGGIFQPYLLSDLKGTRPPASLP